MIHDTTANWPSELDQKTINEVIAAIVDGKYSLACALFLSSTGYNPGLYMPYRTYQRLRRSYGKVAEKVS
ncbi:MAG: HetP family heterocyst commitment protein [Cyanobacteria bacterium J06635_1]